jgi:hypothetical protein
MENTTLFRLAAQPFILLFNYLAELQAHARLILDTLLALATIRSQSAGAAPNEPKAITS